MKRRETDLVIAVCHRWHRAVYDRGRLWSCMRLWNWLLPALFGWHLITFWQAMGLLALCRILFGGISGRGWHGSRRRKAGRWGHMSDEERAKFREAVRAKWGYGPPTSEGHQA